MWEAYKKGYKAFLQLEKSLSDNSVEAYLHDIEKLTSWIQQTDQLKTPQQIDLKDLENFIKWISELVMTAGSQARIISGLRSFFKYCLQEQIINSSPSGGANRGIRSTPKNSDPAQARASLKFSKLLSIFWS